MVNTFFSYGYKYALFICFFLFFLGEHTLSGVYHLFLNVKQKTRLEMCIYCMKVRRCSTVVAVFLLAVLKVSSRSINS